MANYYYGYSCLELNESYTICHALSGHIPTSQCLNIKYNDKDIINLVDIINPQLSYVIKHSSNVY